MNYSRILKYVVVVLLVSMTSINMSGQDSRLAIQYYNSGEYEKAGVIYKKLYEKTPTVIHYFSKYIQCLTSLNDYEKAESEIQSLLKAKPKETHLYISLGNIRELQFDDEGAQDYYNLAIQNLQPDIRSINNIGQTFTQIGKFESALEVYLKGNEMLGNVSVFGYSIANLYYRKGDMENMIKYYLRAMEKSTPSNLRNIKTYFQRALTTDEDLESLRKQLYSIIQEKSDNQIYPEILEWVYIEREEYDRALRQARALDRKLEEDGRRVMSIGDIAFNAEDYDVAIQAYQYIIDQKGTNNIRYVDAKRGMLQSTKNQIMSQQNQSNGMMDTLETRYASFVEEFGVNARTQYLVLDYADFLALNRNDLDGAISVLKELVNLRSITRNVIGQAKLKLGEYYLMSGEIWEGSLLFSQVDKTFKEGNLGEIARFKNAKLSYYAGDFEWAQEQFSVLKSATSRLVSNDAIDLSIFILDNMAMDTTDAPLKLYAEAELLTVQNKFSEAFEKLDTISALYPEHNLEDDILYQKANIHADKEEYSAALQLYEHVYTKYPEELRADNAIFHSAVIYENVTMDLDKAKELYERLFLEYSNSTFAIEARKKFRSLRGDDI